MLESRVIHYDRDKTMARYDAGDFVKAEFKDEASGENEWMWVRVESCDESQRVVFGVLDSAPVVHSDRLRLGQKLAISFDKIRDHRKPNEFQKN